MTPEGKPRERQSSERHATRRQTKDDAQVSDEHGPSHREVAALVREADRFAVRLPAIGRIPIPRPDQLAFYGALGALVAVELIDWPVAVAIGAAHALFSEPPKRQTSPENSDQPE
jgi:hypothetical protein